MKFLIGSLLGDSCLTIQKHKGKYTGNACLRFSFKNYALFILYIYKSLCTANKQLREWAVLNILNSTSSWNFTNRSLTALTELQLQWYNFDEDKKKLI
jgi:hypothetical protein